MRVKLMTVESSYHSANPEIQTLTEQSKVYAKQIMTIVDEVQKVIVGQEEVIKKLVIAMMADGHVLLEGVPGLAKTKMVDTLSKTLGANFCRIQFTPDLLPADITGTKIYDNKNEKFVTEKGPVFSNLILADEINRAPPKVQSALLEAMQERQVSIHGDTFEIEKPFLVLATQNPIESEGTYRLPEAQIDRFMLKTIIDYPSIEDEQKIVQLNLNSNKTDIKNVVNTKQILSAQEAVMSVYMDEKIEKYILDLIFATRYPERYKLSEISPHISFGSSPRGTINLATAAKCYAFLKHRGFVIPEDVRSVIYDVLRHRIGLTYEAEAENIKSEDLISQIINQIEVP